MYNLSLIFKFLILSNILSFLLTDNCQNNIQQLKSEFTINGTEYSIPNGFITSEFYKSGNSQHLIYLLNGTIMDNERDNQRCFFSSDLTQGLIFNVSSSSETKLEDGKYYFELFTNVPSVNGINISTNVVVENNCVTSVNEIHEYQVKSGYLTIKSINNIYNLTFSFETNEFGTMKGSFVGKLQPTPYSSD